MTSPNFSTYGCQQSWLARQACAHRDFYAPHLAAHIEQLLRRWAVVQVIVTESRINGCQCLDAQQIPIPYVQLIRLAFLQVIHAWHCPFVSECDCDCDGPDMRITTLKQLVPHSKQTRASCSLQLRCLRSGHTLEMEIEP